MVYKPVYHDFSLDLRAKQIIVHNVNEMGNHLDSSQLISSLVREKAVIQNLTSVPINGGFNPEFKGYRLKGSVMLGGNRCMAKGVRVEIAIATDSERVTHMSAIRIIDEKARPKFCTREYMPVFHNFSVDVRARKILIHNVEEMEKNINL
jgi:hypothetical protein